VERRSGRQRVFKTRWFERFARKEKIPDPILVDAVARAEKGQVDADLGGGVIKRGSPGQGGENRVATARSSSFAGESGLFSLTGSRRATGRTSMPMKRSSSREAAHHVLQLTEKQIEALVKNGDFVEVRYEQEISK